MSCNKYFHFLHFVIVVGMCFMLPTDLSAIDLTKKEASQVLDSANRLYNEGDYVGALTEYNLLIAADYNSPALLHNTGLSYHKLDSLGKAILFLERAKRIAPLDAEISKNLSLMKEEVDSEIIVVKDFFLKAWFNNAASVLPSLVWLILHVLFLIIAIYILYNFLIHGKDFGLHQSYVYGIIGGVVGLSLIFAGLSYARDHMQYAQDEAIVIEDDIPLKEGADDISSAVMSLNQGVKLYIKDKIGPYYKVKLEDYTEGWVHENEIIMI